MTSPNSTRRQFLKIGAALAIHRHRDDILLDPVENTRVNRDQWRAAGLGQQLDFARPLQQVHGEERVRDGPAIGRKVARCDQGSRSPCRDE